MPSPASVYFNTVQSIFIAYYQRPADAGGLLYWSNRLLVANGDVNTIINEFATSPESVALYGPINNSTIGNVVDAMYQSMFGHLPDAAGKAFYVAGFIAGTFTAGTIALNILNGATGNDAVAVNNKIIASNNFTQIQDGRTFLDPAFGQGTSFNATYAGTADAVAARAWLAPVLFNSATIPSLVQTENFIKASIANAGDPILLPDFVTTANVSTVIEGSVVQFTITAKSPFVQSGMTYVYNLTGAGLTPGDIVGGLTGQITFDTTGKATIAVTTVNDFQMESGESIAVFLVGVPGANQTSVAVALVDAGTGKTIVLTTGVDVPPATAGTPFNDSYFGNATTLNPGDVMDDPSTTDHDTFTYASGGVGIPQVANVIGPAQIYSVVHSGFVAKNIETFTLTADASTSFDMSGVTGTKVVQDINSRFNLLLTNGPEIVALEMINTTLPHGLIVNYQGSTVAGGSNSQSLLLNTVLAGSMVQVDGIEIFNVTTAGTTTASLTTIASNSLATFNLDGAASLFLDSLLFYAGSGAFNSKNTGDLDIGMLSFNGTGKVTTSNTGHFQADMVWFGSGNSSVDASLLGNFMDVTLSNAGDKGTNVTVIGSNTGDYLDVTAGFDSGDSFNGGNGYDQIVVDGGLSVANNAITNTEEADVYTGTLSSFNLNMFDTSLMYVFIDTATSSPITISNIENDGSEFLIINNNSAMLDGKQIDLLPVSFGGTVNLEIDNVAGSSTVNIGDGAATNNLTTLNLAAYGGGTLVVVLDPIANLSTLGLTGNTNFVISTVPLSPTVDLVNGTGTTGNVSISAGVLDNNGASVFLGSGFDIVVGGNGPDIIDIGTGGGFIQGGLGNDQIYGTGSGGVIFEGDDGNDLLSGGDSDDILAGGNGADTLLGHAGYDYLLGDGGNDNLDGGTEDDKLFGGVGADTLTGGGGQDTFYYDNINQSQGAAFSDVITDFVSGSGDFIDLLQALIPANPSVNTMDDVVFAGNAPGFAAAQSALSGTGGVEIVYDTLAEMVYVDVDGNGLIDGVNDMIIRFASPATMQASDFGISQGHTFTANKPGFNTLNPADSYENTTTQYNQNNIVNVLGNQLAGSEIFGGNYDVLNVRTTITAPFNFNTDGAGTFGRVIENLDYERLNLAGGTTALVIGPDSYLGMDIYIGNGGSIFQTGLIYLGGVQAVNSGTGVDKITLTNHYDEAYTHAGNDTVYINTYYGSFYGIVDLGVGADTLDVATYNAPGATFIGGGDKNDIIAARNGVDLSGANISGFDRVVMDPGVAGSLTMDLADYNALPGVGSPFGRIVAGGYDDTVTLIGGGSALLDDNVKFWNGDGSDQQFILATQSPFPPGPFGNFQVVDMMGGVDEIVSNTVDPHGTYDGGGQVGDKFTQNVSASFGIGPAATFVGFLSGSLVLNNGSDVTMFNSQHNSFGSIVGNDGIFLDYNAIFLVDTFTGTTQNTIEFYTLAAVAGNNYKVGGSFQNVTDPGVGGSVVKVLGNVSANSVFLIGGGPDTVTFTGAGTTNVSIYTYGGSDTFNNNGFATTAVTVNMGAGDDIATLANATGATIDMGDGIDSVFLNNVTGLNLTYGTGPGTPDTVQLAGTISGTIAEVANNLNYTLINGLNASGLTTDFVGILDMVTFATNGSFTLNDDTFDRFVFALAPLFNAAGDETVTISDAATTYAATAANHIGNEIEHYKFTNSGDDEFIILFDALETKQFTLDIGSGGADTVWISNSTLEALKDNRLTVTGFNVANDVLKLEYSNTGSGAFQEITVAGTALAVPPIGVIEINNVIATLITPLVLATAGPVGTLIATAIGNAASGVYNVAAYAADGNAYLYQFNTTAAGGDVTTANITAIELIGQLNGVAANSLSFINFVP